LNSNIGVLDISTQAGSVVSEATSLSANSTTVGTSAGAIVGSFTLGDALHISSQAGAIVVEVAVDTTIKSPKAILETRTNAGSVIVRVHPPLGRRNQITSTHISQAGSVNVVYPQEWEGVAEASTSAGSLTFTGEGLLIVESRGKFANRYVKAVKGEDYENKGNVSLSTSAGSIEFKVDSE
jgi:hypothetical protein